MAELEMAVSTGAAGAGELLVVDGPLGSRRVLRGTVGYVKTHHVTYLPLDAARRRRRPRSRAADAGVLHGGPLPPPQLVPAPSR